MCDGRAVGQRGGAVERGGLVPEPAEPGDQRGTVLGHGIGGRRPRRGIVSCGLGSDAVESVRQAGPAAHCGACDFRPSTGRWPRKGVVPVSCCGTRRGPSARVSRTFVCSTRSRRLHRWWRQRTSRPQDRHTERLARHGAAGPGRERPRRARCGFCSSAQERRLVEDVDGFVRSPKPIKRRGPSRCSPCPSRTITKTCELHRGPPGRIRIGRRGAASLGSHGAQVVLCVVR